MKSPRPLLLGLFFNLQEMKTLATLLTFISIFTLPSWAQNGTLTGKVLDKSTSEPILGAIITVENTKKGAVTDFDGNYTIALEPGMYTLKISYISYRTQIIKDVVISANTTKNVTILLQEDTKSLGEFVVNAETIKNTDATLVHMQKSAIAMMDGVSSQQITATGVSNAAETIKQSTGATVEDGKYVVMRGLGDRYSISQKIGRAS